MRNNPKIYFGSWGNKLEMCASFKIDSSVLNNCDILFASYGTPSYEGYCTVIFRKDGKLFMVEGSHCSCYGLEGQWGADEISVEMLEKYNFYYDEHSQEAIDALNILKSRLRERSLT